MDGLRPPAGRGLAMAGRGSPAWVAVGRADGQRARGRVRGRRPVLRAWAHRRGASSAGAWRSRRFWAPASWVSTALVVLGATPGANSCPEAPSASAASATPVVTAAAMRYHRLTRPVTSVPLDRWTCTGDRGTVSRITETARVSLRRVRRRHPRRLGVGIVPKLADLFRARYRADGVDFDSIRLHHGGAGATPTGRAGRSARGRSRWGRISTSRPGSSARAPATGCGCSRMRSRTWCSSPWAWSGRFAAVLALGGGDAGRDGGGAGGRRGRGRAPGGAVQPRSAGRSPGAGLTGRRCCSGTWPGSTRCSGTSIRRWCRRRPTGTRDAVAGYRDLLEELGRAPRRADEGRLRAAHPGLSRCGCAAAAWW